MKSIIIISLLAFLGIDASPIEGEKQDIKTVINAFTNAGDQYNVEQILKLTSPNYRIVMNQLFGSKEITTMDRNTYVQMIKSKKFGGDQRTISYNSIIVSDKNAVVDATLQGMKMNTRSIFTLCKNEDQNWVLLSDTPTIL